MIKILMLILFLPFFTVLSAQNTQQQSNYSIENNYLKRDERVDQLQEAQRKINQRNGMSGFRVQIYTDSGNRSKLRTDRVKAEFDAQYPKTPSYISYDEPYYKLRVGDFRTRLDAIRFLNKVSSTYLSAIIVVDIINFPPLDKDVDKITEPGNN
ncbi:MAG: SPOR domain-containing protein [Bacteroidales bacterium]